MQHEIAVKYRRPTLSPKAVLIVHDYDAVANFASTAVRYGLMCLEIDALEQYVQHEFAKSYPELEVTLLQDLDPEVMWLDLYIDATMPNTTTMRLQ